MISVENKTSVILDLFFCLVLMPILIALGPVHYWFRQWLFLPLLVCIYLYVCYFLLMYVKIPKLLIAKKYHKIAIITGALIAVNYILSLYPLPDIDFVTPTMSKYQTQIRNYGVSLTVWLMFSLVMGYSLTISFVKELYEQLLLKRRIETQRDKAQLAMFKAQISPHFLFNTLNSLYSLVIGTSAKAEEAFIKFTDILRYTYVSVEKEQVPLSDEIEYISNYIDLQRLRLNGHTTIVWEHRADNPDAPIPPMLMLTLVENAFKYGVSTSKDCTIEIHLAESGGVLQFETRNHVMKDADDFRKDMPVGIENCRNRLSALFPGRHSLHASGDGDGVFKVLLTLQIN